MVQTAFSRKDVMEKRSNIRCDKAADRKISRIESYHVISIS